MINNFILLDEENESLLEDICNKTNSIITLTSQECDSHQVEELIRCKYLRKELGSIHASFPNWKYQVSLTRSGKNYKTNKEKFLKKHNSQKTINALIAIVEKLLLPIIVPFLTTVITHYYLNK